MVPGERLRRLALRLFPPRCALCDDACPDRDLCDGCAADLPRLAGVCPACATSSAGDRLCAACHRLSPPMGRTVAPFRYEFPVDWLLTQLKFHARLWHGSVLASEIAPLLMDAVLAVPDRETVVLPVPLHPRRLRRRGYNQAREIARPLAGLLGCRLDDGILVRDRATREQSTLSARERRRNVAGAFRLAAAPDFDHAIVVDDVITTGATSREVAAVLRRGGCVNVTVAAAARAL